MSKRCKILQFNPLLHLLYTWFTPIIHLLYTLVYNRCIIGGDHPTHKVPNLDDPSQPEEEESFIPLTNYKMMLSHIPHPASASISLLLFLSQLGLKLFSLAVPCELFFVAELTVVPWKRSNRAVGKPSDHI